MVSKAKSTKSTAAPKPKAKTPATKKKVHAISSLHVPPSLTSSFLGYHMIFFFRLLFLCNFIHVSFTLQLFVPLRHTLNIFCCCFSASIVDLSKRILRISDALSVSPSLPLLAFAPATHYTLRPHSSNRE